MYRSGLVVFDCICILSPRVNTDGFLNKGENPCYLPDEPHSLPSNTEELGTAYM